MKTPPAVTVVIVNWNGLEVTLECLRSLQCVPYPGMRVLVVDNGSTDGSVEAVRAAFPGVDVLPLFENLRFAGGNNAGIRRALDQGAEAVLLLNNDTVVDADFLAPLVERLTGEERCGMVVPKIFYHGQPNLLWYAGGEVSFWTGTMRHRGIRELDRGQYDVAQETSYATGCCILVARAVIDSIGMLDESYSMYTEDADWSHRARAAGFRILYEPRSRVWHKLSVSAGGHLSRFKLYHKTVNSYRFFARHARWYHWLTFPWLAPLVNGWAAVRYIRWQRRRADAGA